MTSPDPARFRSEVRLFLATAVDRGEHCPAFGAILPPALHDRARAWQRQVFDEGFAGIHWPEQYGGRGLDRSYSGIWAEECALAQAQPMLNLQGIVLAGEAILRSGTEEQKQRFLRSTISGEILWCQLFSEPEAGSDLAHLRATATPHGDVYLVSGQKVWCSNGQFADFGILLARTDPDESGHRGISFFLLDMRLPGIDVRPLRQMTGDAEFTEVFLDEVPVPADALLGPEHGGWLVAMQVLQDERGSSGASSLISLDRRLARLGAMESADPVAEQQLTQLLARGHALKSMLLRDDAGPASGSAAKLLRTELERDADSVELALLGTDGMLDGPATRRFLYSPGTTIAGGTSEIQRNILGERILGLPREPRP